jgi:hypothetical protein
VQLKVTQNVAMKRKSPVAKSASHDSMTPCSLFFAGPDLVQLAAMRFGSSSKSTITLRQQCVSSISLGSEKMANQETAWQIQRREQKEWAARIAADFPEFKLTDIRCGRGWDVPIRDLLATLRSEIEDPNDLIIEWIGEDHGELRMRYDFREGAEGLDGTVENAYDIAQERSWEICELTGERGIMVERGGEGRLVRALQLLKVGDKLVDPSIP